VEERPWSFDGDGHLFRLIFTKRLCDVFADELDRFPKGAGFPGGKHVPSLSEASGYPVSNPRERHLPCTLKT